MGRVKEKIGSIPRPRGATFQRWTTPVGKQLMKIAPVRMYLPKRTAVYIAGWPDCKTQQLPVRRPGKLSRPSGSGRYPVRVRTIQVSQEHTVFLGINDLPAIGMPDRVKSGQLTNARGCAPLHRPGVERHLRAPLDEAGHQEL